MATQNAHDSLAIADIALPGLEEVRETEHPDPGPVTELPPQTFDLTAPEETAHTQGGLF